MGNERPDRPIRRFAEVVLSKPPSRSRRTVLQAATNIPTSVDSGVEAIGRTYDSLGRTTHVTSYDGTTTASTVLNEIKFTYGNEGRVTTSTQFCTLTEWVAFSSLTLFPNLLPAFD